MSRHLPRSSIDVAPIVPEFPPRLDPGERVYPIRFSIAIGDAGLNDLGLGQIQQGK